MITRSHFTTRHEHTQPDNHLHTTTVGAHTATRVTPTPVREVPGRSLPTMNTAPVRSHRPQRPSNKTGQTTTHPLHTHHSGNPTARVENPGTWVDTYHVTTTPSTSPLTLQRASSTPASPHNEHLLAGPQRIATSTGNHHDQARLHYTTSLTCTPPHSSPMYRTEQPQLQPTGPTWTPRHSNHVLSKTANAAHRTTTTSLPPFSTKTVLQPLATTTSSSPKTTYRSCSPNYLHHYRN